MENSEWQTAPAQHFFTRKFSYRNRLINALPAIIMCLRVLMRLRVHQTIPLESWQNEGETTAWVLLQWQAVGGIHPHIMSSDGFWLLTGQPVVTDFDYSQVTDYGRISHFKMLRFQKFIQQEKSVTQSHVFKLHSKWLIRLTSVTSMICGIRHFNDFAIRHFNIKFQSNFSHPNQTGHQRQFCEGRFEVTDVGWHQSLRHVCGLPESEWSKMQSNFKQVSWSWVTDVKWHQSLTWYASKK